MDSSSDDDRKKRSLALKAKGNECFSSGSYSDAEMFYSQAIDLDPSNHVFFGNRSSSLTLQKKFPLALKDACSAITLNPDWPKGYYHHGRAMRGLGRIADARNSFATACKLDPTNATYQSLFLEAEASVIEEYYEEHKGDTVVEGIENINVKYTQGVLGKRVHSRGEFGYGDTVFVEEPLVSCRFVNDDDGDDDDDDDGLQCCVYCMRTIISKEDFPFGDEMYNEVYPTPPAMVFGDDDGGATMYCSDRCKQIALSKYQGVIGHLPMNRLKEFAKRIGRTNPLLIARAFAMAAQSMVNGEDARGAWKPFSSFIGHQEEHPEDVVAFEIICEMLNHVEVKGLEEILTIENYRQFNGAINRNAQTICPVSDLHHYIVSMGMEEQDELMKSINEKMEEEYDDVYQLLQSKGMAKLLISGGSGMFSIANCMNHSCAPNVTVASCFTDSKIRIIAIDDISKGEELCFSYIDEDLSYDERQSSLMKHYHFKCECKKCAMDKPFKWV